MGERGAKSSLSLLKSHQEREYRDDKGLGGRGREGVVGGGLRG